MTSYVKMIDIWMLFTMTIPFLEVVLHTTNEVFRQPDLASEGKTTVVRVQPVNNSEGGEEVPETSSKSTMLKLAGRLIWPISALMFTITFWVVGLSKSYSSGSTQRPDMFDCLVLDLS